MDLLYLAQWLGCIAALAGGSVVLWWSDELPARNEPARWIATVLAVVLLGAVLGLWLTSTGGASAPTLADRADRLADGVQIVSLTFLVLLHAFTPPTVRRWYAGGATLLALGFGVVLSVGAQVSFVEAPWSGTSWLQLALFLGAGTAMHCALVTRDD